MNTSETRTTDTADDDVAAEHRRLLMAAMEFIQGAQVANLTRRQRVLLRMQGALINGSTLLNERIAPTLGAAHAKIDDLRVNAADTANRRTRQAQSFLDDHPQLRTIGRAVIKQLVVSTVSATVIRLLRKRSLRAK